MPWTELNIAYANKIYLDNSYLVDHYRLSTDGFWQIRSQPGGERNADSGY